MFKGIRWINIECNIGRVSLCLHFDSFFYRWNQSCKEIFVLMWEKTCPLDISYLDRGKNLILRTIVDMDVNNRLTLSLVLTIK